MKSLFLIFFIFNGHAWAQTDTSAAERGKVVTAQVQAALKSKLTEEMAKDLVNSIGFCHENAIPLTGKIKKDSPDILDIRRTSLKIRNPSNKADKNEEAILKDWENLKKSGKDVPEFHLETISENEVRFYKPLFIQPLCLTCHGSPAKDVDAAIMKKYPGDKARGYKEGELRGLIRVSIKPRQQSK